ncbi:MAG: protein activator of alkane oxidation PraB [Pseudomonadota bacterium]
MKKALTLTAAMAASALLAAPALASTFSPAPSSGTITGTLTLSQTVTLTCSFSANYSINAAGTVMTITGQSFSGGFGCSALSPLGAWTATPNHGTPPTVDITVSAGSLFGTCNGTISDVAWNNSSGTTGPNFQNDTVAGEVGGTPTPCTINGQLVTSSDVTI